MELDEKRSYNGDIPKAHYKFILIQTFQTEIKKVM